MILWIPEYTCKNSYKMTDYTRKTSTDTVNGPNRTVSTLSGETKSKQRWKPFEVELFTKSTSSGVYAWKTLKLDYTRKKNQRKSDYTAKDQRSK